MSVIIRLQNLPWSANSLDIRHFFKGLSIPEGGVHIVGGEMGDAFIAFSTDEDARQAMMLGGGKIKEVQISLMLSSRSEMQKIIEAARQASMSNSLAHLLAPPPITLGALPQQPQPQQQQQQHHQHHHHQQQQQLPPQSLPKELKDMKLDRKDSSDLSSGPYETGNRRDKRDRSRSRSRDRNKKDRRDRDRDRERDRDRDRDRRRRSTRSRSRSRERRRRRSRSRSRGRDSHNRDRERKDLKDDLRKENEIVSTGMADPATNIPNLEILNPSTWNVMQTGGLAQNTQLLTNFELLRNLASQKGPLIPGGPGSLLPTPLNPLKNETGGDRFPNRESEGSLLGEYPSRGSADFVGQRSENARLGNQRPFKSFDDNSFQEGNKFGSDGRFDRNRGPKMFQNFNSSFPLRNGNESLSSSRFGNFGRSDNGFAPRGPAPSRDRPALSRTPGDFPGTMPPGEARTPNRQDRFSSRDDRVDEFGRSIQLRNRKNASNEESFKEEKFQGNQNFSSFGSRFGPSQQNQRPPPLLRGRDSWPPGDNFHERRGFRGSFEEQSRGGFRANKSREPFGKFKDDNESSSKSFKKDCCVEIQNLSPHIAYGEVRRPFSNLKLIIKEIKFFDYGPNDKKCRIRFLNTESKRKAIQMSNKIQIDHKQVHLIEIKDSEFDECVDEGVKRPEVKFSDDEDDAALSPKDAYVQVKDLSLNIDEHDIVKLFPNAALDKIILEVAPDGKSKSAFLKFQKAVDARVALGTPNRSLGDCIVFLTSLPQYVFNDHLNKSLRNSGERELPEIIEIDPPHGNDESSEKDKPPSTCVLMKNLPLEATDRDICDFFSDIGLVPNKIHLMLDVAGQPSGDAFCEFSTPAQIERACTKNSAHLGKNIVIVCQVTRNEMLEALGIAPGDGGAEPPNLPSPSNPEDGFGRPHCVVSLENIPFRAGVLDIINFFGWSYKLTENDVLRRYNDRGQPTGDGRVCFKSPEDALRAIRFLNNRNLMGRVIRMKLL